MSEVNTADIGAGIMALLKGGAVVIASLGAFTAALAYAYQPRVDEYIEDKIAETTGPLLSELREVAQVARDTQKIVSGQSPQAFIEFRGGIKVRSRGPFTAGETVPLQLLIRRNTSCPTTVQERWLSGTTGGIVSNLTIERPSTRAPITLDFSPFALDIELPEDIAPGFWAYAPVLIPDRTVCPSATVVTPPISEFFEVQ